MVQQRAYNVTRIETVTLEWHVGFVSYQHHGSNFTSNIEVVNVEICEDKLILSLAVTERVLAFKGQSRIANVTTIDILISDGSPIEHVAEMKFLCTASPLKDGPKYYCFI